MSAESIGRIKEFSKVVIYGGGKAEEVHILHTNNISIYGSAVSSMIGNPEMFCGIEVNEVSQYSNIRNDAIVIVGITKKHRGGVVEDLKEKGFANIIESDDV